MTYLITDIASEQDYSNELKELNSLKIDTKRQEVVLLKIGFKIIQSFKVLSKRWKQVLKRKTLKVFKANNNRNSDSINLSDC